MELWRGRGTRFVSEDMGATVWKGYAAGTWWDPAGAGLSAIGAWRAIATPGSAWGAGPANYAASLVDLTGNGNNLIEGNGAVPWAGPTGWGFVAAASQYLDTNLVPTGQYSVFVQYGNVGAAGLLVLVGSLDGTPGRYWIEPNNAGSVRYAEGNIRTVAPQLLSGNLGIANQQGYRDGVADGAAIAAGNISTNAVTIGACGRGGVAPLWYITADIYAVVLYSANPATVQANAAVVAAAMAAL